MSTTTMPVSSKFVVISICNHNPTAASEFVGGEHDEVEKALK